MPPAVVPLPPGIVFRRLRTAREHQLARLAAAAADPGASPRLGAGWSWFGLWDLAPAEGSGLLAAAVVRPARGNVVTVRAWLVPDVAAPTAVLDRVLREVADEIRARGRGQAVVRLVGPSDAAALLGVQHDAGRTWTATGAGRAGQGAVGSGGWRWSDR